VFGNLHGTGAAVIMDTARECALTLAQQAESTQTGAPDTKAVVERAYAYLVFLNGKKDATPLKAARDLTSVASDH
jgi:hypothetical protein